MILKNKNYNDIHNDNNNSLDENDNDDDNNVKKKKQSYRWHKQNPSAYTEHRTARGTGSKRDTHRRHATGKVFAPPPHLAEEMIQARAYRTPFL